MRACKWCACNFCFVGKRDSNIRAPEKFLNVVDIFILQKTGQLVVVKKYEQNRLIKEMHEGPGGGHFGVSRIQK